MNSELLHYGIRLLSRRAHGSEELRRKLRRKGSVYEVEQVVARLQEVGYLNDAEFAWMRASSARKHRGWGDRRIEADLTRLGLDARIIQLTLVKLENDYPEEQALNRAIENWIQRAGPPETVSELKKLFDRCMRLGFSASRLREKLSRHFGQVNWEV